MIRIEIKNFRFASIDEGREKNCWGDSLKIIFL